MIDKKKAKEIHDEINAAMAAIAQKHGLKAVTHNARFNETTFKIPVEFAGQPANGNSIEQENWNLQAFMFGLKDEMFGKVFELNGRMFEIIGLKPRARTRPVMLRNLSDGKTYSISADTIKTKLLA